jgi:hypothetical protein
LWSEDLHGGASTHLKTYSTATKMYSNFPDFGMVPCSQFPTHERARSEGWLSVA